VRLAELLLLVASLYILFFQLPASFAPVSQTVLNPQSPFSTQFTFLNEGYFAAHNIRPICALRQVTLSNHLEIKDLFAMENTEFIKQFTKVQPKDRLTFPCTFPFKFPIIARIATADVTIIITFRRSFHFWVNRQLFRYKLHLSASGETNWIPQPVDEFLLPIPDPPP
jgi:hypothetical protein